MPSTYRRSRRTSPAGGRIPPAEPYPGSVTECLEDRTYKAETLRAMKRFRRLRPWRGDYHERAMKLEQLHAELCAVYGLTTRLIVPMEPQRGMSGGSFYSPVSNTIRMHGRLSVVTYLHEFAHALGYGEQGAVRWSVNLFRRIFPRSFSRLRQHGHCLVR